MSWINFIPEELLIVERRKRQVEAVARYKAKQKLKNPVTFKNVINARQTIWHRANPHKHKQYHLKRMFGLTIEQWNQIFIDQGSCCAICKSPDSGKHDWHSDHCHNTGKFRGILCNSCNVGIGHFKDNENFLKSAIQYLEKSNGTF